MGQRITAWCAANGYELERMYEDSGLSGSRKDNRPGLESCLAHACRAEAALVTYALSRVARSTARVGFPGYRYTSRRWPTTITRTICSASEIS